MREKEKSYYETLKNNPKDYVSGKLFVVENGITKPIEGKWFKLMGDGIPFIYYTDLTREQNEAGVPEPPHPLELIMSFTSERTITATPVLGDSIFTFEQEAGIDSKLGNWIKKNEEKEKIEKKERKNRLEKLKENNNFVEFDKELSFVSNGVNKRIMRYRQALRYRTTEQKLKKNYPYGMECNPCCIMYFLQNYGLIPDNISRKQFEYAFTPLNPAFDTITPNPSKYAKSLFGISIDGHLIKPYEKLFDNLFPSGAAAFLQGRSGAIFPHVPGSEATLYEICKRFHELAFNTKGYEFLREYHLNGYFSLNYEGLKNKYAELVSGIISKTHFEQHVVLVGMAHLSPMPGHYCLIVNTPSEKVVEGKDFWVYPADDPYYGETNIFVPKEEITNIAQITQMADVIELQPKSFLIYPNCAIGV